MVGWARDPAAQGPALIELRRRGECVAVARASLFRPDLLRSGQGHGHYGFRARLRPGLPEGPGQFTLHLRGSGVRFGVRLPVPRLPPAPRVRVEALLEKEPAWQVADFLAYPDSIRFAASLAAMGSARFVDMAFRFALERWPAAHEAAFYGAALDRGELGATALVIELMRSRERADLGPALVSPWDPAFPFPSSGA